MPIGAFRLNSLAKAISQSISYVSATGGTLNYANVSGTTYKVHTFTTTGTNSFIVSSGGNADILLVAGGGGSGGNSTSGTTVSSGAGGGGQVLYQSNLPITAQTYSIVVGAGGAGGSSSGANGSTGNSTTGLGYTSVGGGGGGGSTSLTGSAGGAAGGGGGYGSATQGGGGSGTLAGGTGSSSGRASGGGGSNQSAGTSASGSSPAAGVGGNGGAGVPNTITGSTKYYASGGFGAGQTSGTVTNSGSYGNGANGIFQATAGAFIGTTGSNGVAIIRYPLQTPFSLSFVTSVTSSQSSMTIPATAQVGDVVMLFDFAYISSTTPPTSVVPTGFTSFGASNNSQTISPACRSVVSYKILVSGDPGSIITGLSSTTMNKILVVYRPNMTINNRVVSNQNGQNTASAPTNQTLTLATSLGGWFVGYAMYCSSGTITTRGSTTTATRELNVGTTMYVKLFENLDGNTSFANSTISMADYGSNALNSDAISFS